MNCKLAKRWLATVACASAFALGGAAALADDVHVASGQAQPGKPRPLLVQKGVTVLRVKGGELYWQTAGGTETHKRLEDIAKVEVTGETVFNNAEKAFAEAEAATDEKVQKQKYTEAVSGYTSTANSSAKPWLKEFAGLRLTIAAPRSGQINAAIAAWVIMVPKDPAAAIKLKPSLEGVDPKSQLLVQAIKQLTGLAQGAGKPEERRAIYSMLFDLQKHVGDTEGSMQTLDIMTQLGGQPDEIARVSVQAAESLRAKGDLAGAGARIAKVKLEDLPEDVKPDYYFIKAEVQGNTLAPTAPTDQWKELALDYMRIVAAYPASPHSGAALLKVAEIHETLKEPETALKIYQQIAKEQANTPVGEAAQKAVDRLGKSARG